MHDLSGNMAVNLNFICLHGNFVKGKNLSTKFQCK